jgi:pentapeptide MXKDX repeat protein
VLSSDVTDVACAQAFVSITLGKRFVESPQFDIGQWFDESICHTPLIFILSPGADPMADLLRLAENKGFGRRTKIVSLGQKQGPIAESAVAEAIDNGTWVVLQVRCSWCDAMRCDAMRCDAMRCDAMRCDAMRCDAMRCDAMRCDAMRGTVSLC